MTQYESIRLLYYVHGSLYYIMDSDDSDYAKILYHIMSL